MVYCKRVRSPLKGGVDVELSPKTLLLGANGAGKTAVLQALKLATRGYVDDQEGRDQVKTTGAIARLFSEDDDLHSEAEMSDGARFTWDSERKKDGGFKEPDFNRPYVVDFPFHDLKTLLSGDEKQVKAWIDRQAGGELTVDELVNLLPPNQQDVGKKVLARQKARVPVELATALKKEATQKRTNATKQEKTVSRLTEGLAAPLSDATVTDLTNEKAALQASLAGSVSPTDHDELWAQVEEKVAQVERLVTELEALPVHPPQTDEQVLADQARTVAQGHLDAFGNGYCVICRKPSDVAASVAHWASIAGKPSNQAERDAIQSTIEVVRAQGQRLVEKYQAQTVVDSSKAAERIAEISAKLASDRTGRQTWDQAKAVRREVAAARAQADELTSLARTWEAEGAVLLANKKLAFEESVTRWLGDRKFAVDIDHGRMGFQVGDAIHTALSGTEMSRTLLAILAAQGDSSTPTVHEPEDRAWDPDTLSGVMEALASAPSQIILMSTVPPTRVPQGWTVCHIG